MSKTMLQEGDVFRLEEGMEVYARIPAMFAYSNRPNSEEITKTEVVIGSELDNEYEPDPFSLEGEHEIDEYRTFDTSKLKGEYVVVKTEMTGGGPEPHNRRQSGYPNGHKVIARRLSEDGSCNPDGEKISFYQSGHFTAMNTEVDVISKMKKTFV